MTSVQALSNMEYRLYGNTPCFGNSAVPSMMNGYCAQISPYTSAYPYGMYNNGYPSIYDSYLQNAYQQGNQGQGRTQNTPTANQSDVDKVANFYNEKSQDSQSLLGAVAGGAVFVGATSNPRLIAHPINSIMSLKNTGAMFADIKSSSETALKALWNNPETNEVVRKAYSAMHKVESRNFWKIGAFRKRWSTDDYNNLKGIMDQALRDIKGKSPEKAKEILSEATAKLEQAYVNDGWLGGRVGNLIDKIRVHFGGKAKSRTVTDALGNKEAIKTAAEQLVKTNGEIGYIDALKRGGGIKNGLFFMGIEVLMGLGNIKEAFSKDNSTGMKQIGQTLVKGAGSAAGWALGEAAGVWASAKICAAIGTAVAPGVGTVVGGLLGVIGGSIGCWLTGKLTHALVGQDVGEKVKLEKMKQTPEGQVQLLQLTMQQKNIPADVQQSMQNIAMQYSAAA